MVEISHAAPGEREEIAQFMRVVFPRAKWSIDGWRALLDGRWSRPGDSYAVTARDSGKLVGVLGLVTAHRNTTDGPRTTANMTSWYLLKPYRGGGLGGRMIDLATADPHIAVTDFTSSPGAVGAVTRAGLVPLDTHRLIWHPGGASGASLPVHRDPATQLQRLTVRDRQVLRDHAGLDLHPVVIETPDGPLLLILSVKQKHDAYVTHEVMYVGDPALCARHARAIATSLLPAGRAIFSVDRRLLPTFAEPDAEEAFAIPRFYTPGRMRPGDIDHLYTEVVLLGMKLY